MNKDVRKLLKRIEKSGLTVSDRTSNGRFVVTNAKGELVTVISETCSDRRSTANAIAAIKRETGISV